MTPEQISFDFFTPPPKEPDPKEEITDKKVISGEENTSLQQDIASEANGKAESLFVTDDEAREIPFIVASLRKDNVVATKKPAARKSTRGRMKLSDMDVMVDLVEVPEDAVLFQKNYYSIGEVSNMFKVNISLIRFWENEFDILKPKKNGKGDRLFRPQDVKNLQLIYHLLREKKYTIDGAKVFLKRNKKAEETFELIDTLKKTKAFLLDLKANL
jgi:DNA-binding transcriptional MerR regulator